MAVSVDDAGPSIDTLDVAINELDAEFLAEFGTGPAGIDTSPTSFTGRQNPILARRDVLLQQLLVELTSLLNLNNAQGRFQDFIGTVLDEARLPATRASISTTLTGTPGFVVGDRRVRYQRNNTIWRVPLGTVIGGDGVVKATLTADVAGDTLSDGTVIQAFQDGSDQWTILDESPNFTSVESIADSTPGTNVEGDPNYRTRLRVAGRGSGFGTQPGVLRALQRVAGASAGIDNNRDLAPNANGVPGKSIEALVEEGSDEAVAQAILDSYSDSAGFFGTTTAQGFINGTAYDVQFARIKFVRVIWDVTILTAGAEVPLPDNAIAVVSEALATYTNTTLTRGIDVQPEEGEAAIRSALPAGSIAAGALTVLVAVFGDPPAGAVIPINSRQRARTDPTAQSAKILGTTIQPFNIVVGEQIVLAVNGGTTQAVSFVVSDFAFISAATALEIATAINNRTSGIVAGTEQGALVLRSETTGAASSLNITVASTPALLTTLGMTTGLVSGSDGDIAVIII